jgi:group I intron endonuclease
MNKIAKKITGVYVIINTINNKKYVGSSATCINTRWQIHLNDLKKIKHHSSKLQRSFDKYGEDNFLFFVLAECPKEYCIKLEQWFIDNLKPVLNISKTAGSILGCKRSEAAKEGTRIYMTGRAVSAETRERQRIAQTGQKHSDERRKKNSDFQRGKYVSPETGKKISDSKKGVPRNEATKEKLRLKSLGNTNLKGFKFSDCSKEKMRISHLGKKRSIDSINKGIQSNLLKRSLHDYIDKSCNCRYVIQLPSGLTSEINNAKKFAIENNISVTSLKRTLISNKPFKGFLILEALRFVS